MQPRRLNIICSNHDFPTKQKYTSQFYASVGVITLRFLLVNLSFKGIRLRRGPGESFLVIDFRQTGHVPLFLLESELLASAVARHSRIHR